MTKPMFEIDEVNVPYSDRDLDSKDKEQTGMPAMSGPVGNEADSPDLHTGLYRARKGNSDDGIELSDAGSDSPTEGKFVLSQTKAANSATTTFVSVIRKRALLY